MSGSSLIINIPGVHRLGVDHFEVDNFAECTLHTIDLGVAQRFCGTSIVTGLKANIYKLPLRAKGPLIKRGCFRLRGDIKEYYSAWQKRFPYKKLTKLPKAFTHLHLGNLSKNKPCLKAKGGETRCLVRFCTELMQKHETCLWREGQTVGESRRRPVGHVRHHG